MTLLAIILAFALYHYLDKPAGLKSLAWCKQLHQEVASQTPDERVRWALVILIPNVLVWFVFDVLFELHPAGVGMLLISVVVLFYCLGPDTIAEDLASQSIKPRLGLADDAAANEVVTAMTNAALHRWFWVFFWYVVLGIYGAISYRLACYLAQEQETTDAFSQHALRVLAYPVTVMMTVSLALASDFDRIWRHCKQYLNRETLFEMNCQFLYKSMDFAVEQCEIETEDENKSQIVELTTFTVLKRMLVVWLVFVALLVLLNKG